MGSTDEVTVLFVQDALDADNFSSTVGACEVVIKLAANRKVHFIIDVQTACHDLRLPRFRGPFVEKTMLSWQGFAAMGPLHRIEFEEQPYSGDFPQEEDDAERHSRRVPVDREILEDTKMIQKYLAHMLHEVVRQQSDLVKYIQQDRVRLSYTMGDITEQGLWTPMVPNTFLFYDSVDNCMRAPDEFKALTQRFEKEAWEAVAPGLPPWEGYFPAPKPPGEKATEPRKDPQTAEASVPKVKEAFAELRRRFRSQLEGDIERLGARARSEGCEMTIADKSPVLRALREGSSDVYIIVCAPAGFVWTAYKQIRLSPRSTKRVRLVTGCVFTWDGKDNLVGHQWNECLEFKSMRAFVGALQSDAVPSIFTPTQLFKDPLESMDTSEFKLTSSALSKRIDEAAKKELAGAPKQMSGFSMLGYQGLWNYAKLGPQAIFDPLAVFFSLLFLDRNGPDATLPLHVIFQQAGVRLLRVRVDEELQISKPADGEGGLVFVPDMFNNEHDWWAVEEKVKKQGEKLPETERVKLKSPFSPGVEQDFTAAIDRWYRVQPPVKFVGATV